jgi:hypothetical protein
MRFLANENFPGDAVTALRSEAHDVLWVRTENPGSTDKQVLERAIRERRVLLTFDKDFGELAWNTRLPAECGVVLFRLPLLAGGSSRIVEVLTSRSNWSGHFSVVEASRIRMRRLPSAS